MKRGRVIGPAGADCEACLQGELLEPARPAIATCRLFPEDYAGLNVGPDVECDLALCREHLEALMPWAAPPVAPEGWAYFVCSSAACRCPGRWVLEQLGAVRPVCNECFSR